MNSHNTYSLIFPNRNANNLLIDETQQKAMMQITITVTIKKTKSSNNLQLYLLPVTR